MTNSFTLNCAELCAHLNALYRLHPRTGQPTTHVRKSQLCLPASAGKRVNVL